MRSRVASPVSVSVSLFVLAALTAPGCELFGVITCSSDDNCPTDLPFCNAGFCSTEAGDDDDDESGEGEGEGEGEGVCSVDGDCPGGLCGEASVCLPPAGTEDCGASVGAPARDAAGPVIFNLTATPSGGGCFSIGFDYFDREGDAEGGFGVFISEGGFEQTLSVSMSGGGASGGGCHEFVESTVGLAIQDGAGNRSNTLCVPPAGTTPAP